MKKELVLRVALFKEDNTIENTDYYIISRDLHGRMVADLAERIDSSVAITNSEILAKNSIGSLLTKEDVFYRAVTRNTLLPIEAGTTFVAKFDPEREYQTEDLAYLGNQIFIRRTAGKGNFVRKEWVLFQPGYALTDIFYHEDVDLTKEAQCSGHTVVIRLGRATVREPIVPADTNPDVESLIEDTGNSLGELYDTLEIHNTLEIHR